MIFTCSYITCAYKYHTNFSIGASLNCAMASFSTTTGLSRDLIHPRFLLETDIMMSMSALMCLAEDALGEEATTVMWYVFVSAGCIKHDLKSYCAISLYNVQVKA